MSLVWDLGWSKPDSDNSFAVDERLENVDSLTIESTFTDDDVDRALLLGDPEIDEF